MTQWAVGVVLEVAAARLASTILRYPIRRGVSGVDRPAQLDSPLLKQPHERYGKFYDMPTGGLISVQPCSSHCVSSNRTVSTLTVGKHCAEGTMRYTTSLDSVMFGS